MPTLRLIVSGRKRRDDFLSAMTDGVVFAKSLRSQRGLMTKPNEAKESRSTLGCRGGFGDTNRLRNIINFHQPDTGGPAISTHDRGVGSWRDCFHQRRFLVVIRGQPSGFNLRAL